MYRRLGKFADPPPKDLYQFDNEQPIGPPIKYGDPVVWDPKNPVDDPGGVRDPNLRGYIYSGVVRDSITELPLAGATVALVKNNRVVAQQAANGKGIFQIDMGEPVDYIQITEVSHKPFTWPASEVQNVFDLEPDEKIGPPVLLPPGAKKKDNTLLWLVALFGVAKWQKWI